MLPDFAFAKLTFIIQYQQMDFLHHEWINTAVFFTHEKDRKLKLQGSLWAYDLNSYTDSSKFK